MFVSDDKVHDHNAVFHFTKLAMEHLQLTRGSSLETIIQWTDGCSSQYKSKGPFSDVSCALGDSTGHWSAIVLALVMEKAPLMARVLSSSTMQLRQSSQVTPSSLEPKICLIIVSPVS